MSKIALITTAGFIITAHQNERWRAGRKFSREEVFIPADELTKDELEALQGDPLLSVSEATREIEDPDAEAKAANVNSGAASKPAADATKK